MIVERFFEPLLAQTSYLIGCATSGEALVIDPHRDADLYVTAAEQDHFEIAYVTETHVHADFLSGTREPPARTGATTLLSDEGPADWKCLFGNEGRLLRSGDRITMGRVHIDVVHTPGFEHVSNLTGGLQAWLDEGRPMMSAR